VSKKLFEISGIDDMVTRKKWSTKVKDAKTDEKTCEDVEQVCLQLYINR
jgi:hypothetical protein